MSKKEVEFRFELPTRFMEEKKRFAPGDKVKLPHDRAKKLERRGAGKIVKAGK